MYSLCNHVPKDAKVFCFFFSKKKALLASLFAGVVLMHGAAQAADKTLSVCIDSSSNTAARDQRIAETVAKSEGATLAVAHFNGADDDDGMSAKALTKLLDDRCALLMGYPVDQTDGFTPPGLMITRPYDQTGFVLVEPAGSAAKTLADLPKGTSVSVTFETAPNLYFLQHPNVVPDVHGDDTETLQTVIDGTSKAAMVWQGTVQAYLAKSPGKLDVYPLTEPHARWNVVALYSARAAADAAQFNAQIEAMHHAEAAPVVTPDGFDPSMVRLAAVDAAPGGRVPALYTAAQATAGMGKFLGNCGMCHGAKLQGISGPSLKGPNFASDKADFSVSDVFTIVSQNMPAANPGSLEHDDYVNIMAYLLQQNGYPAGSTALTFDGASQSKVPLRYHGG
jgi:mono/diheme cytochrome c family protein